MDITATSLTLGRLRAIVSGPTSQYVSRAKEGHVLLYPYRRALEYVCVDGLHSNDYHYGYDASNVDGGIRRLSQASDVLGLLERPIPIDYLLERRSYILRAG